MSAFDDLASVARRLGPLGRLPLEATKLYGRGLKTTERIVLSVLRARMDAVAELPSGNHREPDADVSTGASRSPGELLAALLERSLVQDPADSRRELQASILHQLVPDEARILAALAAGPPAPLLDVLPRAGGEAILKNASLIGRTAAVTLPSQTPTYVTHLRELGLVEPGPEDPDNKQGYELLMADKDVRVALKAGELSKLPARTVKRTLVLSARGRELWDACRA